MRRWSNYEKYETEQEAFWAGKFGNEYIKRNNGKNILATKINCFSRILRSIAGGILILV